MKKFQSLSLSRENVFPCRKFRGVSIHHVFLKIFMYFKLKYNYFTVLCWFLPNISMNQSQVPPCPLLLGPPSPLPPHPTPLGCSQVTKPWIEFPESQSKFPLAVYFTHENVGFHVALSIIPPPPSSPCPAAMSISLFFISRRPLTTACPASTDSQVCLCDR